MYSVFGGQRLHLGLVPADMLPGGLFQRVPLLHCGLQVFVASFHESHSLSKCAVHVVEPGSDTKPFGQASQVFVWLLYCVLAEHFEQLKPNSFGVEYRSPALH